MDLSLLDGVLMKMIKASAIINNVNFTIGRAEDTSGMRCAKRSGSPNLARLHLRRYLRNTNKAVNTGIRINRYRYIGCANLNIVFSIYGRRRNTTILISNSNMNVIKAAKANGSNSSLRLLYCRTLNFVRSILSISL